MYISLVVLFMSNAQVWVGQIDHTPFGPVVFLSLFVTSALICSLIVFARPYRLFLQKRGDEALELVLATVMWLALFLILMILGFALF